MLRDQRAIWPAMVMLAVTQAGNTSAQAQGISLRIETETGQTQFRIGEAIGLKLTFENSSPETAGNGDWMVAITGRDRSVLALGRDRFLTLPEAGTSDPLSYRLGEPIAYSGPGGIFLHGKTALAQVDLNQWVRFGNPGHYRVRAEFHATGVFHADRAQREDIVLDSNDIGIDIVAADAAWQAEQLQRDIATLNAVPEKPDNQSFDARMNAARRISYLDTPGSVREAGRLLGTMDVQVSQILQTWLRASQHRDVAVGAMKELLRNPSQPVTPLFLETLAALESWQRFPPPVNPASDPDARRRFEARASITEQLRAELAGVIEQKHDSARAISIKTLLDNMPAETVPAGLRSEIAALFPELPSGQQSDLLNSQWKKISGPEMIPALRPIYDTAPQTIYAAPPGVATAVERLYELDPGQARTLLLDEMNRAFPRLPFRTLAMLPDATLPTMDQILLERLKHDGGRGAEELIARYATPRILEGVKAFYAKQDAAMRARTSGNVPNIASPACEPPLVAYFLRVEPAWGEQVLRESLAERGYPMGRCWVAILGQTASYYVSPEWERVAIQALGDATVAVKSDAVKALGQHGSQASASAVWESFRYWHEWWKDRPAELNEENRRFEQVFLEATAHPANRIVTGQELGRIRDLCITEGCRVQAEQYSGNGK
jgi:hypothetical protein